MFRGIRNTWKKAEQAAIVQTLLEGQARAGLLQADPSPTANFLVVKAWEAHPEWFDGRAGRRPHKVAAVAAVLALGIEQLPEDGKFFAPVVGSLVHLMMDLAGREDSLPLTGKDHQLLDFAQATLAAAMDRFENSELGLELAAIQARLA